MMDRGGNPICFAYNNQEDAAHLPEVPGASFRDCSCGKRDPLSVWCNMHLLCILAEKTCSPVMIAR